MKPDAGHAPDAGVRRPKRGHPLGWSFLMRLAGGDWCLAVVGIGPIRD